MHHVLCFTDYEFLGCFKDYRKRALKEYYGTFRPDAIEKCANIVSLKGFLVFGVQYGGECFSSPDSELNYQKYGPATNCKDGTGGQWAFDAYRFKSKNTIILKRLSE